MKSNAFFSFNSCLLFALLVLTINISCSLNPDLNAYSSSANQAHPNHPRLTEHGKSIERDILKTLQPRRNEITYTERELPRLRYFTLKDKAFEAEVLRNHWHKEKLRLDEKLDKSKNRGMNTKLGKALSIFPDTMESKHKYASRKLDEHTKTLSDIHKDTTVHKELGHLNDRDEYEIKMSRRKSSRELGYTGPGSPRSQGSPRNPRAH